MTCLGAESAASFSSQMPGLLGGPGRTSQVGSLQGRTELPIKCFQRWSSQGFFRKFFFTLSKSCSCTQRYLYAFGLLLEMHNKSTSHSAGWPFGYLRKALLCFLSFRKRLGSRIILSGTLTRSCLDCPISQMYPLRSFPSTWHQAVVWGEQKYILPQS